MSSQVRIKLHGHVSQVPELVTLNRRPEILAVKQVVATEKLHGTNFRVHFPEGMAGVDEVQYGGRNETFGIGESQSFYGGRPVRWFKERRELLERLFAEFQRHGFSDVTIYGEMCGAGIQKGVKYTADNEILFRAFDLRVGENLVSYEIFVAICDASGLPRVPEVWRGEPSLAAFDALLERPSDEGARNGVTAERNLAEGVVIRSLPLLRNVFGEWLIIKHKAEGFAEIAKAPRVDQNADTSAATAFARTYVVPGRVINALGRLRDAGVAVTNEMSDMQHLVPAMIADLHKECAPELSQRGSGHHRQAGSRCGDEDAGECVSAGAAGRGRRVDLSLQA